MEREITQPNTPALGTGALLNRRIYQQPGVAHNRNSKKIRRSPTKEGQLLRAIAFHTFVILLISCRRAQVLLEKPGDARVQALHYHRVRDHVC